MDQVGVIHKHDKRWRTNPYLRHVVNLCYAAGMCRRRIDHLGIFEKVIENSGRNTKACLFCHCIDHVAKTMDSLLGRADPKEPAHRMQRKSFSDFLFKLNVCCISFFNGIPFIDEKDQALPCFMDVAYDLLILLCQHILGIQNEDGYVAVVDSAD